ncbi:hydantoinase/oxoprolinase family protein [Acuticoccus sediminis]|uniref:hydantoinase/oxoprolinase family protein n=1 Tax=Acuticoccus sediminis TaxID=2184697 RepID=UPI00192E5570|nr:hydantoinase/oxoprolinase family protein [Acuticoccus sediminis]
MLRLGVDIGGTFTDFALVESAGGRSAIHKRLTTPDDPARAVIEGVEAIAAAEQIAVADIAEIVHGTTLVTNALIERRGARAGMLVTKGFRDTFDIGKEVRYDLYDLRLRFADPLVERRLRVEIPERMLADGTVHVPLDEEAVAAAVTHLVEEEGITALAICYLHAYADPAHEERSAAIARDLYPDLYISTSSGVFPYAREFERWTTTCANAYGQPMVDAYLARLEEGLERIGFTGHLAIIGSGGGLMTLSTARQHPVRLLESGPAAGVLMAARIGQVLDVDNLLAFDLGGTTAKGALVRGGRPFKAYTFEAAHTYKHKSGSGLTLQIPVIDMAEIGSGGGSIVSVDELGLLRVGPRSASAVPGPACYSRGGTDPTLTDANLTLGYLDPDFFLGGQMALDAAAAENAIAARTAPLGLETIRAAWGIHDIANEDISRAFRMHATERGFDYRRSAMVASGGGGPIHAARIARKLKVPQVIFPAGAGVMSAFGMLVGATSFEIVRSYRAIVGAIDTETFTATLREIEAEATAYLIEAGLSPDDITIERRLDMRYAGQGYDIEVAVPGDRAAGDIPAALPDLFATAYRATFDTTLDQPLEIASLKVEAIGPRPELPVSAGNTGVGSVEGAKKGTRRAYFPAAGGLVDCPVYDRYRIAPGERLAGPCLVEERESTILLDAGDVAVVHPSGSVVATIAVEGSR